MTRKILKIIALILAVVLIMGMAWFANALVGNPVSKHLATKGAEKHISENYAGTDLEIERVGYDFKTSNYHVKVSSPTSIDTHFSLYIDFFGKIYYDSYADSVLTGQNTADRICKEYRDAVDKVLESSSFPYESDIGFGDIEFILDEYKENFDVPSYAIVSETLTPDAFYDLKEMGSKAGHIIIYVSSDEQTPEKMAEVLLTIKASFDEAGISFYAIDCSVDDGIASVNKKQIQVEHFLYSDIYEEGLTERVKKSIEDRKAYYEEMDRLKEQEIAEYQAAMQ